MTHVATVTETRRNVTISAVGGDSKRTCRRGSISADTGMGAWRRATSDPAPCGCGAVLSHANLVSPVPGEEKL